MGKAAQARCEELQVLMTGTKMLTGPHLLSKQVVGYLGAQMWPGEALTTADLSCASCLLSSRECTNILSLSFSLKKRLFSEGHGPKTLLGTSHVLSHDEPMSWQCTNEKKGWQRGSNLCEVRWLVRVTT